MNLEKAICDEFSQELASAIDFQIIGDILVACGWHRVELDWRTQTHCQEIKDWVLENCADEYRHRDDVWFFKSPGDAVMFKLKWL